jgi:hypothetical protein
MPPVPHPSSGSLMNDLIPIALFVGCLLATLGLVRVCEWLQPPSTPAAAPPRLSDPAGSHVAIARQESGKEADR